MSNSVKGFTVALKSDLPDESAANLKNAILCLQEVIGVESVEHDSNDWINRMQIRRELSEKLWEVLYPKKGSA